MKDIIIRKSKTIQEKDPEEFDRKFNESSEKLNNIVEIKWDSAPMCVHLIYEERERIPESISEEFLLAGIKYYCKDCHYFMKGKNKRCKSYGCRYSICSNATEYTPACEFFLEKLKSGEVKPVD